MLEMFSVVVKHHSEYVENCNRAKGFVCASQRKAFLWQEMNIINHLLAGVCPLMEGFSQVVLAEIPSGVEVGFEERFLSSCDMFNSIKVALLIDGRQVSGDVAK